MTTSDLAPAADPFDPFPMPHGLDAGVRPLPSPITIVASAAPSQVQPRVRVAAKRAYDIVGALVLILLTLPTMLIVALAIFVTDPGPVLFRQTRLARDGKPFRIRKFRTMVTDAEDRLHRDPVLYRQYLDNHHKLPADVDPRITRVGRLLRSTSLDELPQLFNVLGGSMSLVGPRPVVRSELVNYGADADMLLSVRPGMTGLWQVRGRSSIGYPERAGIDLEYASSWTMGLDISILLRTVTAVARRTGAG
jgi:lipopolysaccharide/colanic/teichoic acid biosynthesis glycosyltransferase